MRTKRELRQMRRDRGEPGGFHADDALALVTVVVSIVGMALAFVALFLLLLTLNLSID